MFPSRNRSRLTQALLLVAITSPSTIAYGQISDCDELTAADGANCDEFGFPRTVGQRPDGFWSRETMTGDWKGYRTSLRESGVTLGGKATQMAFGVDGGINRPLPPSLSILGPGDTFKYTGRTEYDAAFDLEKFGGPPLGRLHVRAEHWYGQFGNVSLNTGALTPAVFPALLPPAPERQGEIMLTNFRILQPISEGLVVFAGKTDFLGEADQNIFAGGDGTQQFINQAFVANPAFLLGLPYSSFTAGFALPQEWGRFGFSVIDPRDRSTDLFRFDDLFARGIIMIGETHVDTNFFGLPGQHHVGAVWKHHDQIDLRFNVSPPGNYPYNAPPGPLETKSDAYSFYYGFDQFLVTYTDDPRRGWGFFGRASVSDPNPTPIRYFLSLGIGGDSDLRVGHKDTFGVGIYQTIASNQFGPIPRAVLDPRNGTGVELYYNFQVTPWLNVTPDIQFIRPGNRAISEDAFVYGIRLTMIL
jgi:porin